MTTDTKERPDLATRFADAVKDIEQQRDELRVRLHLGKAEARDEWDRLQVRLSDLKVRLARGTDEVGVTAEKFEVAMKAAIEELKQGLDRIRAHF